MVIAINTVLFSNLSADDTDTFIHECFSRVAASNPQHHFVYIFDKAFDKEFISGKNIAAVKVKQVTTNTIARRYWYDYRLSSILKKHKIDVLINCDPLCSLRTKIQQHNLITSLSWMEYPQFYKKGQVNFFNKMLPKYLNKANSVITVSEHLKQILVSRYKTIEEKITVIPAASNKNFTPITWEEKEKLKEKYADGKEYFLFIGPIAASGNLMNMLKAFSHFKKWQKSNMQFVIAGEVEPGYEKFLVGLKLYKYRDDIKIISAIDQQKLIEIISAAYAFVAATYIEDANLNLLNAMQAEIPVIVSKNASAASFTNAVLTADPDDHKDIAAQLILLYKDEARRNAVIEAGKSITNANNWDKSALLLASVLTNNS